jgi:hypothetical protein
MIITQIPIGNFRSKILIRQGYIGEQWSLPIPIRMPVMRRWMPSLYDNKTT